LPPPRVLCQTHTNRVHHYISAYLQQVAVFLDEDSLVPALEKMTHSVVPLVECLGVNPIQLSHASGEVAFGGFNQKVKVVIHEAIGMAEPVVALADLVEDEKKVLPILIIPVDGLLFVSPGGDMIYSTWIFDA